MNLSEYTEQALRTESKIDTVTLNLAELIPLLESFISLTEMLDSLKKKIFYQNDKKYKETFQKNVSALQNSVAFLKKSNVSADKEYAEVNVRLLHGIIGVMTESGELAEILVKHLLNNSATIDKVNLEEEVVGDIGWYTAILVDEFDLDWEGGLQNNINKLRIRYPEKFSVQAASERNLNLERKALEK